MREIVLDTETTGLNYKAGHRVTEVGCTERINHIATKNNLQFYCSVEKKVSEEAVRISGLTNDFLSKYPPFAHNADTLIEFIKNDTLIIHNADFDMGFLNNELKIMGKAPLKNKVIDTVALARKNLNTKVANLNYLCRRFSIDLSERELHGALLDTQLLAEVYLELLGGKQIKMNLDNNKDFEKQQTKTKNINIEVLKIIPTKEEILLHKKSIKQIKNPLWRKIDY